MSSNVEESSEKDVEGKGVENGLELIEGLREDDKAVQAALAKSERQDLDGHNPVLSEYEDLRREMTALRNEHEKAVADKRDVFLQLQKVQLQVNGWETNYNTLKENNERLKRENSEMKKQVTVASKAEHDADREQLTNEIASLNAKITSMKEAYEYIQLEKSTLEEKVSILQKTISSLENTNESLLMEKDRLQQGLDSSLRREREGSFRSSHEYSTVHRSYSSSVESDALKLTYDEFYREKYSLEYQLRVAKEKVSELESRPRTEGSFEHGHHLVVSHSTSHRSHSKLEEDYKQLLHDKFKVVSELEMKHRRELEEKQTSIFKLEQEIREMRSDKVRYDELDKENEFLVKEKFNLENELCASKEKVFIAESSKVNETRLERELVAYNDKYAALEKEYSTLMQDKRKFEADLYIQVRKEGEEKQAQIFKLEREILELRTDKARYDDVCREKEYPIKERASMENELRIAREKAVEYESRSMMESRTEQELAIFRDRYSQLEKEYSDAMQDRRRHEADLHIQVRREVEEKQAHIYKLESEMHELRMNADRYEDVLKEKEYLIKERFNLENEIRTSRQRIVEFESRLVMDGRLESELTALKELYAKLESDYSANLQEKRRLEAEFHIQVRKGTEEKQSKIYQLEVEMQELRMGKARYEDLFKEKEYLVKEKLDLECELRTAREKILEFESRLLLESRTEKEIVFYQEKLTQLEKEYSNMMQERRRYEADLHIQVRKEAEEQQAYIYKIKRELHELQLEKTRYDDLYKEKEFLLKERYNLENEFRLAREKITEMESQSMMEARTEKELGILQERYTKLEEEYSLLIQENRRMETEDQILVRKEVEEKQSHIYKLEVELRELRMDRGRFDELTKEKEFLIKEKFNLEAELRTMREKIMEYETRSMMEGRVEKEFTLFKEKYTQLERDYSVLIQDKRRMETEGQILARKEVEEKKSHIYRLEQEMRDMSIEKGRYDDLYKEKEFLLKERYNLENELRIVREKVVEFENRSMVKARTEKELLLFHEKYQKLEKDYSLLMQDKRQIEADVEIRVRRQGEERQGLIYKLESEIHALRADKERYDEGVREKEFLIKERYNLETELRETREKMLEYESSLKTHGIRAEQEMAAFKNNYVKLEEEHTFLVEEKKRLEEDIEIRVKKEFWEKQESVYKLEKEIRELKSENEYYQTTVEVKNASISELRVGANNLQRQVENLKKELFVAEEAYEKAELKLKEVLKSEYKPVTTYVVRRTVRHSSSSSQQNDAEPVNTVVADDVSVITKDFEATSTPKVEQKPVAKSSTVSEVAKTIDFNENVAEEKPARIEVEKDPSKDYLSESGHSSSYYRPTYSSLSSPRSSSVRSGSRYGNKYTSGCYGSSSYTAGSSYRSRQPTSRYSAPKKYY